MPDILQNLDQNQGKQPTVQKPFINPSEVEQQPPDFVESNAQQRSASEITLDNSKKNISEAPFVFPTSSGILQDEVPPPPPKTRGRPKKAKPAPKVAPPEPDYISNMKKPRTKSSSSSGKMGLKSKENIEKISTKARITQYFKRNPEKIDEFEELLEDIDSMDLESLKVFERELKKIEFFPQIVEKVSKYVPPIAANTMIAPTAKWMGYVGTERIAFKFSKNYHLFEPLFSDLLKDYYEHMAILDSPWVKIAFLCYQIVKECDTEERNGVPLKNQFMVPNPDSEGEDDFDDL